MKLFLIVVGVVIMAAFGHAATTEPEFLYVTPSGVTYQPRPDDAQPVVRVLNTQWGYDLKGGADAEVCIVTVEELHADAPITPPPGSFLVLNGIVYEIQSVYETETDCVPVGM